MKLRVLLICVGLVTLAAFGSLADSSLLLVAWNVESAGANPEVVATRMASMPNVELWDLCEVSPSSWTDTFENTLEQETTRDFEVIHGTTGGQDRLVIIYDTAELDKLEDFEIG